MNAALIITIVDGVLLFLASALFAYALSRTRYRERDTWKTVGIGVGLILIATGLLVLIEIIAREPWWIFVIYTLVAATPIIVWQEVHYAGLEAKLDEAIHRRNGQETEHATTDARRG
jgi:ABC-type glycerol-3-phosphate transport system permease component